MCDLTVVIEARRSKDLHFNWNDNDITTFKLHYLNDDNLNEKKINWSVLKYLSKSRFDVIVVSCYHTHFLLMLTCCIVKKMDDITRKIFDTVQLNFPKRKYPIMVNGKNAKINI